MNVHEFEGKNEEEAISKAIEALGLDREEIDVEIVEAKKAAFLFGGGKVRIRVHLEDERGVPWNPPGHPPDGHRPGGQRPDEQPGESWQSELDQDGYPDKQPADYRHPDAWDRPPGRGQRSRRDQGGRPGGQRSRRSSSGKSGARRAPGARSGRSPSNRLDADPYGSNLAPPRRSATLEPEGEFESKILEFLKGLFEHVGIPAEVRIVSREDGKLGLDVDSPDSGILIGKRGQTLEAIQTVANVVAGRLMNGSPRVIVDSQNYRMRRERSLVRMAQQTADEVRRTRQSRLLEAMNPFERRLIHTTLSEDADVETASEGEGLYKRVRILYRGPNRS